ncbi:conserved hypothetical protein [Histoplasma capsulatum G186AR]|uniref:AB hydrolase-1 domain-containing protein n=2 Tax=Ajellomyces capsulatus TaxID=5037 RepID=C0NMK3_AJECG|nr:uncharacterized protein HCBG_03980 [Histoplasma capsulatum G186AR]EEH07101.1 conserved hypothetical protein [Histoplasma capsulatum G186AR]KAG5287779.1 putative hydrolase of the alpha/beta superfamily domain-containing protein [Histoplasma capsulatum]QSS70365.1 COG2945 domain, predicted hydrolase of the alpha/beta superfamily domain-containing protein [Histoplasma capsulatum G186AR]
MDPLPQSQPQPLRSFTIPSVYDGIRLDCRLFHPHHLSRLESGLSWRSKGAIVAHPYAPIGGNYDNPIVCGIASELLKVGYIVVTFNFRGASESAGRTSWSARPELGDYVSVYGFLIHYLIGIDPDSLRDSLAESWNQRPSPVVDSPESTDESERMEIVLAGYSYGSMIVSHLPSIEVVLRLFAAPVAGSSSAEILQQAEDLSTLWNLEARSELSSQTPTLKSTSTSDGDGKLSRCVSMGSSTGFSGKKSSMERAAAIRQSIKLSRKRLRARFLRGHGLEDQVTDASANVASGVKEIARNMLTPTVSFLLVSPVIPPITNFMTLSLFDSQINLGVTLEGMLVKSIPPEEQLTTHRTLAVFGNNDLFASAKRLRKWALDLRKILGSMFEFVEIDRAGHFWLEEGTEAQMRTAVRVWACSSSRGDCVNETPPHL